MRRWALALLFASWAALGEPSPALAQSEEKPAASESVALDAIPPKRGGGISPLTIVGTSLAGLGGATIMASGICWLVAAAEASRLDDDCPGRVCVEGSTGARSLETARDAKSAAIVLFAIGLPVTTGGFVLMLYADPRDRRRSLRVSPSVGPDRAGADLHLRF
jgi:hypothetical protein